MVGQICCKQDQSKKALEHSLQANLVREQKRDYQDVYNVVGLIGEGSISNIYRIKKKEGEVYALKEIDLAFVKEGCVEELRNETYLLKDLDHPNIIKAYETFIYRKKLSIVLEVCSGGDLYTRHPYTEVQAAAINQQVLSAVNYMHKRNVIHRDIKFENIMFENKDPHAQVKLIDFGLSTYYDKRFLTDSVGSVYTMSPEVIQGMYTSKADLWSVGVVAYMLMSGVKPFWGPSREVIVRAILKGEYDFNDAAIWHDRLQEGKDFVPALLQMDPNKRLNARQETPLAGE